ncbi:MAG TPA: IclR family transcriptional regulator [Verrucomicrobiae bacterium]|nr:IclR family transcriptional regulator [Verrucomicrobiae bacterium]
MPAEAHDSGGESVEGEFAPPGEGNHSVRRALEMLATIAGHQDPLRLGQLARELSLPKSSAHSLLRALAAAGFVEGDARGGYVVGLRAFEVGVAYLARTDVVQAARSELAGLRDALGVTAHVTVLNGVDTVTVAKEDPRRTGPHLASSLGARLAAGGTAMGRVQLAHLPDAVERLGLHGRRRRQLDQELERVRTVGTASDRGATAVGVGSVAAPVFDAAGVCCAAIGVSFLLADEPAWATAGPVVAAAAGRITARLGGQAPSNTPRPA